MPGLAALAVTGAVPAAAGPPNPLACLHRKPQVQLTAEQAAAEPWPEQALSYRQAWRFSTGNNVTVAVVDSGVDADHEQLRGAVLSGYDVTTPAVSRGGTTDCAGHGTAVAGLVAARPAPGSRFAGVAPDARILPVRQTWGIDDNGRPTTSTPESLVAAMRLAVRSGAQVVNVSVTVLDAELTAAQRKAFADVAQEASDRDVLLVAATGNRSEYRQVADGGRALVTYPAQLAVFYPNVVAVSGVTSSGLAVDDDAVTGPFVTVAAPSRDMPSTLERGGLTVVNGTSYAAPIVSGVAALIRSRYPQLSAAQVRERMTATADHPSTELPNPEVGWGVVNPVAAVTAVLPQPAPAVEADRTAPPLLPPVDPAAGRKRAAVLAAAAATGAALLAVVGAAVLRRGRRRGWRPGVAPAPAATGAPAPAGMRSGPVGRPAG